jgi:hypothetical protein
MGRPELSNSACLPSRAGGSPFFTSQRCCVAPTSRWKLTLRPTDHLLEVAARLKGESPFQAGCCEGSSSPQAECNLVEALRVVILDMDQ